MKKKSLFLIAATIISCMAFLFVSCKGNEGTSGSGQGDGYTSQDGADSGIILTAETLELVLGDKYDLRATDGKYPLSCQWTSSNTDVVTVDKLGTLTAVSTGETTITATNGDNKATCKVTVGLGTYLPVMQMNALDTDSVQVALGNLADISTTVSFNGKVCEEAVVTYTLEDTSLGRIKDGIFTPMKVGETTLTITATWRGITSPFLTKSMPLKVVHSASVLVNGAALPKQVTVYTLSNFEGNTYEHRSLFETSIFIDGAKKKHEVVIEDETIATYDSDNKQIVGNSLGTTKAIISYTNGEDVFIEYEVPVNVLVPTVKHNDKVTNFSALDGDFLNANGEKVLNKYFNGDVSVVKQNDVILEATNDGKVMGVQTDAHKMTQTEITVLGATYGYIFDLEGYTKIVDEASDLLDFQLRADRKNVEGYFYMTKDLDLTNYDFNKDGKLDALDTLHPSDKTDMLTPSARTNGIKAGFTGVFDGNGHTINGYRMGRSWGFMASATDAVLKDVAFTNVDTTGWQGAMFCWWAANSVYPVYIENVYVSLKMDMNNKHRNFTLFNSQRSGALFVNNLIVDMGEGTPDRCIANGVNDAGGIGFFGYDKLSAQYASSPDHELYKGNELKNIYIIASANSTTGRVLAVQQHLGVSVYAANDYRQFAEGATISFDANLNPIADANGEEKIYHYKNVYRYDTFDALRSAGVTKVGSWNFANGLPTWG